MTSNKSWLMVLAAVAAMTSAQTMRAGAPEWHFECSGGVPIKLVWQTESGRSYDLWQSADLAGWTHVDGFPQAGTGGLMEHPFTAGTRGFFKLTSEVSYTPDGFALIPAGSFLMGDQTAPNYAGDPDERPQHTVQVSAFYMAKYEVTKALWDEVRAWGASENRGYTDLPAGEGKAANHPVHSINWYAMVKWCNARSEKEGRTPCYTVSGVVYRTGSSAPVCNWAANGYRLPSEAEWERAARGGVTGLNFPWGDTISHSQANYCVYSGDGTTNYYSYDVTPRPGYPTNEYYHPAYNDGVYPYSSPAGSFAPNGYGLYDMAGNVFEWCWDWYSGSYYSSSPGTDPRGPASGSIRVFRGGSWDRYAYNCRAANRNYGTPAGTYNSLGFRPARSSVP